MAAEKASYATFVADAALSGAGRGGAARVSHDRGSEGQDRRRLIGRSSDQMFLNYPAGHARPQAGRCERRLHRHERDRRRLPITQGKVDAAIMTDPALAIVRRAIAAAIRILADTRTAKAVRATFGVDAYPSVVLYSTAPWLDVASRPKRSAWRTRSRTASANGCGPHSRRRDPRSECPPQFRTEDADTDIEGCNRITGHAFGRRQAFTANRPTIVQQVLSVSLDRSPRRRKSIWRRPTPTSL